MTLAVASIHLAMIWMVSSHIHECAIGEYFSDEELTYPDLVPERPKLFGNMRLIISAK